MKKTINLIIALGFFMATGLMAQSTYTLQNENHPLIETFKVRYKSMPQSSLTVSSGTASAIQVVPEAKLKLKENVNVSKIYLKIINPANNNILYQINYQTNSGQVTSSQGKKLFENANGTIFISNGQALALKPYIYQIQTEDNNGNLSLIYSVIQ